MASGLSLGGFKSVRGVVDADDDGQITADEVRGHHYARRMQAQVHQPLVSMTDHVSTRRYTPAQERAIAKLMHSREVWARYAEEDAKAKVASEAAAKAAAKDAAAEDVAAASFSVWKAARLGKTAQVQHCIEHLGFDIRTHCREPVDYGNTLLHIAVWNGHVELVQYLVERAEIDLGPEGRKAFANDIDTVSSGTTPLINAARTKVGHLNDRLKIVQILADAGADSAIQDASGDNCLHWAARLSSLPIVRYLCKHTTGAVFAVVADNGKRRKPLDVAEAEDLKRWKVTPTCKRDRTNPMFCVTCQTMHYSSVATVEIYRLLLNLLKGCNMRLKIQKGKRRREADMERKVYARLARRDKSIRSAQAVLMAAQREVTRQHEIAETQRTKEEEEYADAKGDAAVQELEEYVKTSKEGKRILKQARDAIYQEMKRELKKQGKKANRDTSKIALAKAKAQLFKERHIQVAGEAQDEFRSRNPPIRIPRKFKFV